MSGKKGKNPRSYGSGPNDMKNQSSNQMSSRDAYTRYSEKNKKTESPVPYMPTEKAKSMADNVKREIQNRKDRNTTVLLDKKKSKVAERKQKTSSVNVSQNKNTGTMTTKKSSSKTTTGTYGNRKRTVEKNVETSQRPGSKLIDAIRYGGLDGKKKIVSKKVTIEDKNRRSTRVSARRS